MSSAKEVYLTEEGLEKIKEELNYLKLEKRPEIVQALKDARALGDLSENAEYDAARGDQAIVEARILELEQMVEKAVIIKEVNKDVVSIGTRVTIEYVDDSELEEYSIVGSKEADPFLNKISNESPIAKAIMGMKIGDKVSVESPNGTYDVKIVKIA
jgi:transcription elongation factor GreA